MEEYIRSIAKGRLTSEMAEMVNARYGAGTITEKKLRFYNRNHGITSGVNTCFSKGHIPMNKGLKQEEYLSAEAIERTKATRFGPGHAPANELPIGTIKKDSDGYLMKKVQAHGTQRQRWECLHRLVWEENNGPIPNEMLVSFKNGNKDDVRIENLMLISLAENQALLRHGLRFEDAELTETGLALARLKIGLQKKKKGEKK